MTVRRTTMDVADLSVSWEAEARQWIQWARTPGHDSYWRFHRDQFLRLLPPPGRQTLDIGCGEGRLARDLKELGHRVVGIDSSPLSCRRRPRVRPIDGRAFGRRHRASA
jgi:2-polyprenyl-3-methyl-5-hydroxy-6-metoxy-1,4-benzoquinol methylase